MGGDAILGARPGWEHRLLLVISVIDRVRAQYE